MRTAAAASPRSRPLRWLGLGLILAGVACEGPAREELRSVTLPSLEAFPESVRAQLRGQQARLHALANRDADPAELGAAHGAMGRLLLAYNLDRSAEPPLQNATQLVPGDYRWSYYLAYLYDEELGRPEQAVRYYERTLDAQPDYLPARIRLARLYIDLGRDAEADALLHDVLRLDPQNAVAHLLLGQLAGPEDPARAIEHYEAVLRTQPEASVVHNPLALAYRRQGDLERSRQHLERRGQAPVRLGDPLIEELQEVRKGSGAKIFQGNELLTQGRYREAAALFQQAAREDSGNVSAQLNYGFALAQAGAIEEAIEATQEVLRLEPDNPRAHYNLGVLFDLRGDPEPALEHLRASVETDPGNAVARLRLANHLWGRRRCGAAIPHFQRSLADRPGQVDARLKLAMCHVDQGDYGVARGLLEAGVEALPREPRLQDALVRVLAASPDPAVRDGERALELARRLVSAHRRRETLEGLAMAYAEVGRFPEAIRAQQEAIDAARAGNAAPGLLEHMRAVLGRYRGAEPCRTPWSPTVFGS